MDYMDKLGTTGEKQVADAMEHLDHFLFDTLSDPDQECVGHVPQEPAVGTSPVPEPQSGAPHIYVKLGTKQMILSEDVIPSLNSKRIVRMLMIYLLTNTPHPSQKEAFVKYVGLLADQLQHLHGVSDV